MKNGKAAIPSDGNGGLDGTRSGHFGHCDVFTIIDINDGEIGNVTIVPNTEHSQGGCLVPVQILASHKVNALIAAGMGMRPLTGFTEAGIDVYYDRQYPDIRACVRELISGNLEKMTADNVCSGGH